jgi:4-hydroxybenzoate polyprenyltransferase
MMRTLRAFLILGRVSNLPTVWSNCLAAWWLGGQGCPHKLPYLLTGASFIYIAGMFLNDAFDADFDGQYRKERPIPSGAISVRAVWLSGCILLVVGCALLFFVGRMTGIYGLILAGAVVLYDAVHKRVSLAPLLMASCRFLLYLVAASTGFNGVPGLAVWGGLAMASYIVGLSYLARRESMPGRLQNWPLLVLLFPFVLAWFVNDGDFRNQAVIVAAITAIWILRSVRYTFWGPAPQIGRTVSSLLAGIVWVDWLAVPDVPRNLAMIFVGLFVLAMAFQRFVPAT